MDVGDRAPDFTLPDQDGRERSLKELRERGNVALVFYRSADWWPICRKQLVELQSALPQFEEEDLQIVGISYDLVDTLKHFAEKNGIAYPLLSDEESRVITAYGLRNRNVEPGSDKDGIPHPGAIIVDRNGVVREMLLSGDYRLRPTNEELLEAARKLKAAT